MDSNVLIIGFVAGAIVMWILDWFFYGRGSNAAEAELAEVKHKLHEAESTAVACREALANAKASVSTTESDLIQARADATECGAKLDSCSADLAAAQARIAELEAKPAPASKPAKDDLKKVNGIGPVYEKKLNAAGIITYAQLAASDPETIKGIIQPKEWQSLDIEDWLVEAKSFAG